jgi:D-aminoacyl-tRNA deacylase
MRALIQRVIKASVSFNNSVRRSIGPGLVVFLGVTHSDGSDDANYIVDKILGLRIFSDNSGKMNLSVRDVSGSCLLISQFTLYGDVTKGRRPSFVNAAPPQIAIPMYELVIEKLRSCLEVTLETGEFGADMVVEIVNDGPVTFMIES